MQYLTVVWLPGENGNEMMEGYKIRRVRSIL